ncbi:hypothetical protein PR202_gb17681 [Eleusine coracana subsp. coracana]|uniref:USP domain-containing protein n=1 Tax=Eleusine coracana subsp. coracana TaxID=191504 RepID=A0AAV5F4Y9_ELECO|nr:hypothetical protein PR202_gb17681 [Eleusine coracana subsp. coracana]
MAEVSTAAPEGVLHRRIEFHLSRRPHTSVEVGGGGFRMETLNPDAAGKVGAVAAGSSEHEARRPEKGDAGGMDPELSVARIYLGRIGAGLQNLGNTCYLNSVLQCLTYTEPFAAYLQSGKHKSSCRTAGFCALCALQNHVKTALQSTGKIVTPSQIVKNLRLPSESQSAYDKSLVHKIFGGRLRSQVRCTRCSHCSNKFDPFLDLSLDIAKATTLVRALQNFTEEELLDGGEKQYQCERCRQKVVAKKRFTIDKPPNVLTIHLKRFSPFNPRQKIDKKVDFQPSLDLKPFVSDSKVRQVREADVLRQKAYMLFYVRDSIGNSIHRDNVTANGIVKKTPEKISCLNGTIGNEKKIQNINNSSIFAKTSIDGSKHVVKTEGAAASQNNGLPPLQKALALQNNCATLPTYSVQSAATEQRSSTSYQPSLLLNSSGKQAVTEKSSRELPPKVDKLTSVAPPVVNGSAKLFESVTQTSLPQTIPFFKSTAHGNGMETGSTTQTSSNKDAVVSNNVMPINGCLTSCGNVKDFQESPGQANKTTMALVTSKNDSAPELSLVDSGKQICSGHSEQIVVASSCNDSKAKKVNLKPKKFVRYPVVNMWFGSRQLLVASLKLGKKTKHKRTKRSVICKAVPNVACLGDSMNEQLASTSATAPSETLEHISRCQKHANTNPSPKDDTLPSENRQKVAGACSGAGTSGTTDTADLMKIGSSSSMDQTQPKKNVNAVGIRAMDLMEATVPCWDDIEVRSTKIAGPQHSKRSIGYVLDEWDEEYDRGKTKKVRRSKDDFDGSNPFQDEANYVSQQQTKQKSYQGKSWNKPNRLHELRV